MDQFDPIESRKSNMAKSFGLGYIQADVLPTHLGPIGVGIVKIFKK